MALKYWGKTIVNYEAMQWPSSAWYHISTSNDWTRAMDIWVSLWAWDNTWDHMSTYLKIPPTWLRTNLAEFYWDGEMSVYLTPEIETDEDVPGRYFAKAFQFVFNEEYGLPNEAGLWGASIADWCSIRPFKNIPVVPDSSWTVLYQWTWNAWIFYSATLWIISLSSDGTNWISLSDKNLWASVVYNDWDTLSEANCWNLFQRWNNYWFLWQWNLSTTETQVDWSPYWPWNYYSSNEYYIGGWDFVDWSSVRNDDRWWWITWAEHPAEIIERCYWGKLIDDYSAMRWPCPEGFHVPKSSERSAVINAWVSLWARATSWTTNVTNFRTYLKLPNIVYLFPGDWLPWTWWSPQHRFYWGCVQSWSDWSWRYCDALDVVEDYWWSIWVRRTSSNHWCPVRPFKDKPVVPDSSWTILYQNPGDTFWIYHNAILWLISISSDWTTWITIADKNAWATNVYNFWDTITSANWWWLYQWWNNYPFSINWATTTSSTRVDTTWYGPWNYYSGSTFITGGVNDDWFSPRNCDLWWWVTWVQQKPAKVTEVYYGSTKIWPKYSQIVINSDLTTATLSSLQSEWWDGIYSSTGTYRLNSNGLAWPTTNSQWTQVFNVQAILYKDISEYIDDINTVDNVEFEFDTYGDSATYSGWVECWLRNSITSKSIYSSVSMGYSSTSSYRYTTVNRWPPSSENKTSGSRNWLYHIVFTYNVNTGVIACNITQNGSSVYNKTYTVSENARIQIKNSAKILYFSTNRWGNSAWDTTYIKNVKLTVNFN